MPKQPSAKTNALVDARDEGRCVRCGVSVSVGSLAGARPGNRHHRKPRRHNDHTPANLILLCGSGTTGCHGYITENPAIAYAWGWSVRTNDDPWEVPAFVMNPQTRSPEWRLYDVDGGFMVVPEWEALARLRDSGLRDD